MLCRRLTGRDGRPRRGSPARRRFSCGQLVRLGRSGQEDHHIRWHTAADAVCAPTQAPVSKSNACVTALTARRRLPQTLNTNAHAPASTTLVCANSRRRATFEADSPRRHGVCARVYCARVQARSISAGTCGPTTAHSASQTRARLAMRSARSGPKLATLTGPALPSTCSKRSRRIGRSSASRRDAAIDHRRTGDLSLRLRRAAGGGGAGRRGAGSRSAPCAPPHHLEVRRGEWRVCGGRRARQTTARAAHMRSDF